MNRKTLLYGTAATLTAPIWVPVAALAYVATWTISKASGFAFRHPGKTAVALGVAATIMYTDWDIRDTPQERKAVTRTQVSDLESKVADHDELRIHREEGFAFYYVKQDDTLSHISSTISGDPSNYSIIAQDNRITSPNDLPTGTLLRLRQELCSRFSPSVYEEVPLLQTIILPGDTNVSDVFPDRWEEILELNKSLGLEYENEYQYKEGKRVIHYVQ